MLRSLTLLLLFQLAGVVCARLLAVPIPGPVIGMLLMLLMLLARRAVSPELRTTSLGILEYLSLLFVPAGVGGDGAFAIGVAAHGIGTARAFQLGETAGAFAGLAMALNALATALLVPVLVKVVVP